EGGCVINISSVLAKRSKPAGIMYSTLKAGLERMTEMLAFELEPKRIRVNAIRLGAVPGYAFMRETLKRLPSEAAQRMCAEILPQHHEVADRTAELGRRGRPEDVAELVCFIASERAAYMSGSVVPLD